MKQLNNYAAGAELNNIPFASLTLTELEPTASFAHMNNFQLSPIKSIEFYKVESFVKSFKGTWSFSKTFRKENSKKTLEAYEKSYL